MKKCLYLVLLVLLVSCSKDNDNVDNSRLEAAYQNVKNKIYGTWVMDGYHSTTRSSNPYMFGWQEDLWFMENNELYILSFDKNGGFVDNKQNKGVYSIYMDANKNVYNGKDNSDFNWPFKTGAIYLKISCDNSSSYYTPYYIEIKNDGRLYLYNSVASTGGDGVPQYRYKKQ